jgi:hypothetical protein
MILRTAAEWLTPVKASGMAAYLIASVACAATAVRAADRRASRLAAALCALDVVLLLDMGFNWRWKLNEWLRTGAISHHWYSERSGPQVAVLVCIGAVLVSAGVTLSRRFLSVRGATLAISGALLSIGCWLTEVVSLHQTDAVLFHRAGPLMVVSFVWMIACAMTAVGMWAAGSMKKRVNGTVTKPRHL